MKNKNKIIVVLLIVGIIFFCIMQFIIVTNNRANEQYLNAQLDATTQDINYILPYKNAYMGNNSNTVNLFSHLPLATSEMKFQLFPNSLTIQIDYNDTLLNVGKKSVENKQYIAKNGLADELNQIYKNEVKKSLIYNSTAAFALIDNLEHIDYHFSDVSYEVSRVNVALLYNNFENILNKANWKNKVQDKLNNSDYITDAANSILIKQN